MSKYDTLRHKLDTDILNNSTLATDQEQRNFVDQTFVTIHTQYTEKAVNHEEYVKLINRLAAYQDGKYNDHIDTLAGAAQMDLLDFALRQDIPALDPEQSRKRRDAITKFTGMEPIQPDEG